VLEKEAKRLPRGLLRASGNYRYRLSPRIFGTCRGGDLLPAYGASGSKGRRFYSRPIRHRGVAPYWVARRVTVRLVRLARQEVPRGAGGATRRAPRAGKPRSPRRTDE
jgi:hypothetical protein